MSFQLVACSSLDSKQSNSAATSLFNSDQSPSEPRFYSGKLNLQTIADGKNKKSMTLNFELQGNLQNGQLNLLGPLGTQVMQLQWEPHMAILRQGKNQITATHLGQLTNTLLGFELPLDAVFQWLENQPSKNQNLTFWSLETLEMPSGKKALRLEKEFLVNPKVSAVTDQIPNNNTDALGDPDRSAMPLTTASPLFSYFSDLNPKDNILVKILFIFDATEETVKP